MEDRPPDDADLAARARDGDHRAFAHLVEMHREVAFRVAYLVTGSAADAEDAAQVGFVKAYAGLHRFRPEAPFRPWLLRIVANEAKNRRRSRGRRRFYESEAARVAVAGDAVPSPEAAAERAEEQATLVSAVARLPERERLVVMLRYFLEMSEEETARIAGVARGTVKSRTARALRRLRGELGSHDDA